MTTSKAQIKVTTFNPDTDEYGTYKHEVDMQKIIGKVKKEEQAMMLVYELPKGDSSGIRDKIMNEMAITELKKEDGIEATSNTWKIISRWTIR